MPTVEQGPPEGQFHCAWMGMENMRPSVMKKTMFLLFAGGIRFAVLVSKSRWLPDVY